MAQLNVFVLLQSVRELQSCATWFFVFKPRDGLQKIHHRHARAYQMTL